MNPNREELLFQLALSKPAAKRAAWLDAECEGDPALRQRLEALLAAHEQPETVLATQTETARPTIKLDLADAPDEAVGQTLGRYKLLERVGEGGCGVVYVAEQTEPVRRRVALKVIKLGMDTKQVVARFEAERQALAMMDHPNIAKVLDAGTTDVGRPFFVMELVRGIKITDYCDQANLSTKERLDLFIKVCQAIQHAHQKGIIHRDIKPSNILVTLHDGVPVPKVIDFGIAKATEGRLTDNTVYTQLHQFIGTPAYMSPEQAEMSGLDIDTRSDIYSLGVLLYELLAGSTPFDAKELMASGIDQMRKTIREKEPMRPSTKLSQTLVAANVSSLKSSATGKPTTEEEVRASSRRLLRIKETITLLRGDLDWIVMKCLEKDRARRYDTANGLAADLKRHLNNEPVAARPPSAAYRFQKAWRRNKLAYSAGMAVAAALLIGITLSTWQLFRATRAEREQNRLLGVAVKALDGEKLQRAQADEQRQRAVDSERATRQRAYASDINLAQQTLDAVKLGAALELLNQPDLRDQRGWEWRYLWQQSRSEALSTFCSVKKGVGQLAASPDGRWLAVGEAFGMLRLWDLTTRQPVAEFSSHGNCRPAFSGSRSLLAYKGPLTSATNQTGVLVWDPKTRLPVAELPAGWCRGLEFSADEKTLVTCHDDGKVVRWQLPEGRKLSTYSCDRPPRYDNAGVPFAISRDAGLAAVGGFSGEVIMVNLETGKQLWRSEGTDGRGYSLAFSPDGKTLAVGTGTRDSYILLLDSATGHERQRLAGHRIAVSGLVFWPDGRRLASAGHDQTIGLWDLNDPARIPPPRMLRGHKLEVWSLALLSDGRTLASGSKDGEVCLWDTASDRREPFTALQKIPADAIWCLSGAGQVIRGANLAARELLEWRGAGHPLQRTPMLFEAGARRACWSPDGRFLAVGGTNGAVQVWEILARTLVGQFSVGTNEVVPLQFDRDSSRLAVVAGRAFEVWTVPPPRRILSAEIPAGHIVNDYSGYVFSSLEQAADLNQVLMVGPRAAGVWAMSLWAPATGAILKLRGDSQETSLPDDGITSVAFSPDGALLALSGFSDTTRVHDTRTGRQLATLRGFFTDSTAVGFSPDGQRLAVGGGSDGEIKIYHTATWRELLTVPSGAQFIANVRFSRDGDSLRARVQDQLRDEQLRSWHVPSWEEIAAAGVKEKAENKQP